MKLNKIFYAVAILLIGATFSCADKWNDHYEVKTLGEGTLWEAISNDEQLSNFATLLEATGYNTALDGSQVFTVFAPTNDSFTEDDLQAALQTYNEQKAQGVKDEKNTIIKEIVQNHIALYNYSVSTATQDTTISMMNGKNIAFNSSSFADNLYARTNVATGNGVLFAINGKASFKPNVLEYLEKDASLDSVMTYLYGYNIDEFLPEQSVPGEIINGKTHYLDSVTYMQNEVLTDWLDARINNEDSSYVMLAPTNELWDQLLADYQKYYVYDEKVSERDSFEYNFPRLAILRGTIFSQNENRNILTNTAIDSVMSTNAVPYALREMMYGSYDKKYYQYDKPYGEGGIFASTTDVECSNGVLKKTSVWNIKKEQTFLREIVMEGEDNRTLDSLNILNKNTNPEGDTSSPQYVNVSPDNPYYNKVSGNSYIQISPVGSGRFTNASFYIRDVLSNVPYDVYLVIVPATAGDTLANEDLLRETTLRVAMQCHDEKGNAKYVAPDSKGGTMESVFKNDITSNKPNEPGSKTRVDLSKIGGAEIDSVYVGTYTFPVSSYQTSEPQVKLWVSSRAPSSQTRIVRLDCIVLKPRTE